MPDLLLYGAGVSGDRAAARKWAFLMQRYTGSMRLVPSTYLKQIPVNEHTDEKTVLKARLASLIPSVSSVETPVLDALLENAQLVRIKRGQFIFHAGDSCAAFLVLLDGVVKVLLTSVGGREIVLYRIQTGGSCILTTSCLLSDQHYPAEAIAETDVEALAIPSAGFQSALEQSKAFRTFVFDGFSNRLTNVIQRIEDIAFTPTDAKLAGALLALHHAGNERVTHQELAVELGTAREVVSRHLKRFEKQGIVRLGRGRIVVLDAEQLKWTVSRAVSD